MLMRVAVGIHKADVASAIETYHLMSQKYFTHASPTLFNAGTLQPQMSSCFLVHMKASPSRGPRACIQGCGAVLWRSVCLLACG